MTNNQIQDIDTFINHVEDKTMDSLDFTQLVFTIEEIITEENYKNFYDEKLSRLVKLLADHYKSEFDEMVGELNVPARAWVLEFSGAFDGGF